MAYYRCIGSTEPKTVDLTFTVEGTKADNITISDSTGTVVSNVIFGSAETSKEITLTIPESGGNYTFTSSVAKATDGSGSDYSKTVALSEDTTSVKVMPSGALYWYGNECEDVTGGFDTNGKYTNSSDYSFNSLYTRNTNSISSALPTYPKVNSLAFNNLIGGVNGKKLCILRKCGDVSSIEKAERTMENDSVYIVCNYINNNISYGAFNITVASNKTYFGNNWLYGGLGVNNQTNTNYIYALWLE